MARTWLFGIYIAFVAACCLAAAQPQRQPAGAAHTGAAFRFNPVADGVYHVVGTAMEYFKTGVGSWIYPEASLFRIGGVPLFSGFMYASIGSYIARVWRLFDFRFTRHPPLWTVVLLGIAAAQSRSN